MRARGDIEGVDVVDGEVEDLLRDGSFPDCRRSRTAANRAQV
jgi:hypothetical protein